MTEKLLLITEETSSPPYFLIVKLNNKMVFDTIGQHNAVTFRTVFRERLTRFSIETHDVFKNTNNSESTMKFSNTDYLWVCLSNKEFFDSLKPQLSLLNEINLLESFKIYDGRDIEKEELEKELESVFTFCFLQKTLSSKQTSEKKFKL